MMYRFLSLILVVIAAGCTASADNRTPPPGTSLIRIVPGNDVWNVTARKNPEFLFDKQIGNMSKMDQVYMADNALATPMVFFVSLGDSCYKKLAIDYFHGYGNSDWTITLYDSNRTKLADVKLTGVSNAWASIKGIEAVADKAVRFLRFETQNPSSDVRELLIFGIPVARCSPVAPLQKPTVLPDPGISFQGGSAIGGKDTNYMKLQSGYPLYGSFRSPSNVFNWVHDDKNAFDKQNFEIDTYGDFERNTLRFQKRMGTPVMFYINGASIQTVPGLKGTDNYNMQAQSNTKKDIPPGSDSTQYEPWTRNHGRMWKVMAYMWGSNRNATLGPGYRIYGNYWHPLTTPGQDKIKVFEIGNEDDKPWFGMAGYHSPIVLLQKLKVAWDSIKSVDPKAKVYLGALLSADTTQWKAMYFLNYWLYPGQPFPADGLCFNQYISNRYGGQSHQTDADAVSPEQFQVTERIRSYAKFRDHYFPGRGLRWTEIGYAIGNSDYDVKSVPGIPDSIGACNFMVRTLERAAMVPNGLDAMYNYFHTSDGSGVFGSMKMVVEQFNGYIYAGSHRMPLWWWYAARMNTLHDYNGWSTTITDGDSTGVTVTRYDNKIDANKKVYYVCRGTYNGSVSKDYKVKVGSKAVSAILVTMAIGKEEGERTTLPVAAGTVTIPVVNEGPQYLIVTSK